MVTVRLKSCISKGTPAAKILDAIALDPAQAIGSFTKPDIVESLFPDLCEEAKGGDQSGRAARCISEFFFVFSSPSLKVTLAGLQREKSCGIPFSPTRKSSYASHVMAPPGQLSFKLPSAADVHADADTDAHVDADADAGFDRAGILDGDVGYAVGAALHLL